MPNLGPGNFNIRNILAQTQRSVQTGQSAGAQSGQTFRASNQTLGQQLLQRTLFQKSGQLSLAALFNHDNVKLNAKETSLFLKEALKLPQELRDILLLLAFKNLPKGKANELLKQNLAQLLQQQGNTPLNVPLQELQQLLGDNTKEATQKLMKLLQSNQMAQAATGTQIAELAASLGKLGEKIQNSPREAMETLMLMYIPWYPLTDQQKLMFDLGSGGGDDADADGDNSAIIYLETNTMGRFKVVVSQVEPLQMAIKLFHEKQAEDFLDTFEEKINAALANDGLPACVFMAEEIKEAQWTPPTEESPKAPPGVTADDPEKDASTAGFKDSTRQKSQQHITVQPSENISLVVLNTAFAMGRIIFEVDESNRMLQQRAQHVRDSEEG